jgi:methionyl-tRNA formyltransferase
VHRAVIAGDTETGVTIMRVVKALDAGPMLANAPVPIGANDTTSVVEAALGVRGAQLLIATLADLEAGRASETAQDESLVTYAPKLTKAEGRIDWQRSACEVHNLVRGLWPWPHAYTVVVDTRVILHRSRLSPRSAAAPAGTILAASVAEGLHIACGDGALEIVDLQLEGKRVMSARDVMASPLLKAGARFSTP